MIHEIEVRTPSGRLVILRELCVEAEEAVARMFTADQARRSKRSAWERELIAAAIHSIDGVVVDHSTFKPKSTFPLVADWNVLGRAYGTLPVAPAEELVGDGDGLVLISVGDGREVKMGRLSIDQEEQIELAGSYGPRDWQRAMNDKVAASIVEVDGTKVGAGFDARVELPLSRYWATLGAAYAQLNGLLEDAASFFPSGQGWRPTTAS